MQTSARLWATPQGGIGGTEEGEAVGKAGTRKHPLQTHQTHLSLCMAASGDAQLDWAKSWATDTVCNRALPMFGKGGTKCHGQLSFISINNKCWALGNPSTVIRDKAQMREKQSLFPAQDQSFGRWSPRTCIRFQQAVNVPVAKGGEESSGLRCRTETGLGCIQKSAQVGAHPNPHQGE